MGRIEYSLIILFGLSAISCQTASELPVQDDNIVVAESISQESETPLIVAENASAKKNVVQVILGDPNDEEICKEQIQTGTRFTKIECKKRSQWGKSQEHYRHESEDFIRRTNYGS